MIGAGAVRAFRSNQTIGKAAMKLGGFGPAGRAEGKLLDLKSPNAAQALVQPWARQSRYNRGVRRMGYAAGGTTLMGANMMRSPGSSGSSGMAPQSSGGMTGAY